MKSRPFRLLVIKKISLISMYRPTHLFKKGIFPFVEGAAIFFFCPLILLLAPFVCFLLFSLWKPFHLLKFFSIFYELLKKIKYNILHWNSAVFFITLTRMLFRRKFELSPDVKIDQEISLARIVYKLPGSHLEGVESLEKKLMWVCSILIYF